MRLGIILISVGILILFLGEVTFPLHVSTSVKSDFTSPSWFSSAKIHVNNGTFMVYSDVSGHKQFIQNITKGDTICLDNFTLIGKGNATITFKGFKIFYNTRYFTFSIITISIGAVLEILKLISARIGK
ncbi:hypothetical protein [Acidianus sp. HS-5]|uniref:hypothetical protein n=1 Tax=Acidianus sp. HS-5 TaxID=2886040 RepID=UPI001F1D06B7|nr:hypothetical protein [Acidianus sp. HS-5]BDC18790.1 hypothetical protein HS5_16800 [Acidianus sp. HS-5]